MDIIKIIMEYVVKPDIVISISLVAIVVCMLLAARSKTLPVKGLFYLLLTGFGVLGIWAFKKKLAGGLEKEIEELEKKIGANDVLLTQQKQISEAAEATLKKEIAEAKEAIAASQAQVLLLIENGKEMQKVIYAASEDELLEMYRKRKTKEKNDGQ